MYRLRVAGACCLLPDAEYLNWCLFASHARTHRPCKTRLRTRRHDLPRSTTWP